MDVGLAGDVESADEPPTEDEIAPDRWLEAETLGTGAAELSRSPLGDDEHPLTTSTASPH